MAALRRLCAATLLLASSVAAFAATIVVDGLHDPHSRLELRTIVLPDGTTGELYVLEGDPIVVIIDDRQRIEGRLIEFDPRARVVRVVGPGSFETEEQRIEGVDLEIALEDELLSGRDVLIILAAIDVQGIAAVRQPGQIDVSGALFSPCARCEVGQQAGQDPASWDYGFRARVTRIYPGDRLIAEGVTLLVRGVAVGYLPLLVLPLSAGDRQPVLLVVRGGAAQRARVVLRWPYVAGRSGLGTLTVRYEADVDPGEPAGLPGRLLGGAVTTSYLGGSIDHRFYTDTGSGVLQTSYRPEFLDPLEPGGRTAAQLSLLARYATAIELGPPSVAVELERDDERMPGRWEYAAELSGEADGIRGRFDSQGYVDGPAFAAAGLDPLVAPSYADRVTPRQTPARLRLEPVTLAPFRLGALRFDELALDVGAFEDASNPANRRAAARPLAEGGRLLLRSALTVTPITLWGGGTLQGSNAFEGRYYDSAERLVRWRTLLSFQQSLDGAGTFTVAFDRDINEGETPFRFDTIPLRNAMEATARLALTPAPWLRFETRSGYTLADTRRPELVGLQPLESQLHLFADRPWIDITARHRAELLTGDPGALDAALTLQSRRAPAEYRVQLRHVQDFRPEVVEGVAVSDTRTALTARAAVDALVSVELTAAYRPEPPQDPTGGRARWEPLDLRLTVGSTSTGAVRPGARIQLLYDLEAGRTTRLQLDARALLGPVEVDAFQRFDLPVGGATDSRLRVRWEGRASAELQGAVLLPPGWLGLDAGEPRARTVSLQVRDLPLREDPRWELTARTTFDPALAEGAGGRRNSALDLRVDLAHSRLGPAALSLSATARYLLADDALDKSHLQRATMVVGADVAERVGVQGSMSYVATYAPDTQTFARAELVLDRVSVTVRATEQLFVGARVSDVWDFTRTRLDRSPWNLQPELYLLWDRCCWALAASWNTATGTVRVALAGPGGQTGIEEIIDTPLALPRRPLALEEGVP